MRNNLVTAGLALLFGLLALYIAWAADLRARLARGGGGLEIDVPFLLLQPEALRGWMMAFYEEGMWGLRAGGNMKGIFLALVWLIEAGVIVVLSVMTAHHASARRPFCEHCRTWIDAEEGVQRLSLAGDPQAANRLLLGDVSAAGGMLRAAPDDAAFLRLDLSCCPSCQESNYLSVERVRYVEDKKGNLTTKTDTMARFVSIPHRDVAAIRNAGYDAPAEKTPDQAAGADTA